MARTYVIGECHSCGKEGVDVTTEHDMPPFESFDAIGDERPMLCRECLGIEEPSPPPGPPAEAFYGGLRPEARRWLGVSERWLMGETEDFD